MINSLSLFINGYFKHPQLDSFWQYAVLSEDIVIILRHNYNETNRIENIYLC